MSKRRESLLTLLEPSVNDLGYDLVDVDYHPAPKSGGVLRVFIDAKDGIGIEDCEAVSRQVSALLDVSDPISGHYNLEVSSPGLDRILRTVAHFEQFVGSEVNVLLHVAKDGRRKFRGKLLGVIDSEIEIDIDGAPVRLAMTAIEKARLVPEF